MRCACFHCGDIWPRLSHVSWPSHRWLRVNWEGHRVVAHSRGLAFWEPSQSSSVLPFPTADICRAKSPQINQKKSLIRGFQFIFNFFQPSYNLLCTSLTSPNVPPQPSLGFDQLAFCVSPDCRGLKVKWWTSCKQAAAWIFPPFH